MNKIIQSLWIGRPLSLIEQLSITSFIKNGHEYHLYCYNKVKNVPVGTVLRDAAEILPVSEIFYYRNGSVAAFADLFRYKLLYHRGGWWMDTDMVCLQPLNFVEPVVFAGQRRRGGTLATNSAIKLPQGHPVALECYQVANREDRKKMSWGKIGPFLLDRIVSKSGLRQFVKAPKIFCPLDFWKWKSLLICESGPLERLLETETRTIHLWHEMWRRASLEIDSSTGEFQFEKTETVFNDTTPFVELLRRYGLK